jgi:hypothetical protein
VVEDVDGGAASRNFGQDGKVGVCRLIILWGYGIQMIYAPVLVRPVSFPEMASDGIEAGV